MLNLLADNLTVERGGRTILSGFSFSAASGETVLLTGPNGAGKTTLLRTLAGFIRPSSGQVKLEDGGADLTLAEQCHYVGHLNAVKPSLTAKENLAFWVEYLGTSVGRVEPALRAGGASSTRRDPTTLPTTSAVPWIVGSREELDPTYTLPMSAALDRLGLGDLGDVPAGYLSAGQKRRLGLARLLVARRPVWLLDEPTVSLDAVSVDLFAGLVAEHLAAGGLAVAATHMPLGLQGARELKLGARTEAA